MIFKIFLVDFSRNLLLIKAGLLLNKPHTLHDTVTNLYKKSFEAYKYQHCQVFKEIEQDNELYEDEDVDCLSCNNEKENCCCEVILNHFIELNRIIAELDLIEHLSSPAIASVVYLQLTQFIETNCKGEFLEPWLDKVFAWMNKGLIAWLKFAIDSYGCNTVSNKEDYLTVDQWQPRLQYFTYKAFAELRISELFEIIVEYPESLPAINDLKDCMAKTETRQALTDSLRQSFENRLLHPAVNTDDILTQYVSAIRTLRELDPVGVILENVCAPLREYLRSREDTIKCIITCLTDQETGPDLAEELFGTDIEVKSTNGSDSESDGEDWMPDPIDAKTDLSSKSQRTADIINILVNIYGSQDMFVSQYRILLADRILTNFSYDVTNERRYLELLKRRFGEHHLHFCDIMLKDIQDSHRINRLIKDEMDKSKDRKDKKMESDRDKIKGCGDDKKEDDKENEESIEFNSFILSSAFWPTLSEDTVESPPEVKSLMDTYTEIFKQSKGMRTLEWYNNLGSVELEVELDDGVKSFNATPAQATLILKFQEKEEWNLTDFSKEMNITKTSLRSRIAFWVGQGVIIEKQNDVYAAAQSFQSHMHESSMYESDDETVTTSSQNQKDEELQVYWSYVVGMLTNIGSLPLERIHSMLKMFAVHGDASSQCSVEEVKTFLQSKVSDGELLYVGGMYKLPKVT